MSEKLCIDLLGDSIYKQILSITADKAEINAIIYELHYELGIFKKDIGRILQEKEYGFGHLAFDETRKKQEEQDGFIENPFEVAEGIFTCGKCGGTKTYSYAKQVRSCDEGMNVFVTCVRCKNKWMHSG